MIYITVRWLINSAPAHVSFDYNEPETLQKISGRCQPEGQNRSRNETAPEDALTKRQETRIKYKA